MNLSELQADLRHFAAEREWQPFHTPQNLSTALMVEAAELAEIFQWTTPEESRLAHQDPATQQRIGEEIADVLLYLLQVADHSQIDIERAVKDKLARNALKYPATQTITRVSPVHAVPGTHVLLDFENVDSAVTIDRLTDSLRKMGDKRPTKAASLWRSLKSFLGAGATEEAVEVALHRLIEDGVVKVDSVNGASYPRFNTPTA